MIRVRMYTVGFGDCFLITIPGTPPRAILVDAGFHAQGKGAFAGKDLAEQVLSDLQDAVGSKRVDVLIASHRHQDHIYTFNSEVWDQLEVGEVWMPWVEDRENPKAVALWKKKHAFALALEKAMPGFGLSAEEADNVKWMLWNAGVGPGDGERAAWSNQGALDRLITGFPKRRMDKPRFLPTTDTFPETFTTDVLPGVRIHVLGPPRDPKDIEELDPIQDGESYRALALRALEHGAGTAPSAAPFADAWVVGQAELSSRPLEPDEEQRIQDLARGGNALTAAQHLDDMINSTSLVVVLEIGSARLLLAGDAEWSTWKRILKSDRARALLKGATFVKVSHHGSHNGTPKSFVEQVLASDAKCMISTQEGPGTYRHNIPLPDLMTALRRGARPAVRSDETGGGIPAGFTVDPQKRWVDLELAGG